MEDQLFENIDYTGRSFPKGDYECCTFRGCIFEKVNLSGIVFLECLFVNCNLSMANIAGTTFNDTSFVGCKLLGLRFDACNKNLRTGFNCCVLDYSSFYKVKLKGALFQDTKLLEVNFTEADLTSVSFAGCDLSGTVFENTILVSTDFRSARNFIIDPERNSLRKAKFSSSDLVRLLTKYQLEIED